MNDSAVTFTDPVIETLKIKIKELATREKDLELVYLHGSASKNKTTPLSDIDLAFSYRNGNMPVERRKKILLQLLEFFDSEFPGKNIDVQLLNGSPIDFCYAAIKGILLYARTEKIRVEYETSTISAYLDFKPILDEYFRIQRTMIKGEHQ